MLAVQTVPKEKTTFGYGFSQFEMQSKALRSLYSSLRENVPVIDAAIEKIIRLVGTFNITCKNKSCQKIVDDFCINVKTIGSSSGMECFIYSYLDSLLTYGEAVGEMVLSKNSNNIAALYNASLDDVMIKAGSSPLDLVVSKNGFSKDDEIIYPKLILSSLLNPTPGTVKGNSILRSLPFVSSILMRIFESLKNNWQRVGDVRFAVTYNPGNSGSVSPQNAKLVADEWSRAMRSDRVCDFVSVGDVSVKAIGSECQMPECDIPIKHILEQILAKLGIPPFLLGLSWSSTERMSEQQADILTSELEYYRTILNPVIRKIISTQLMLNGYNDYFEIEWSDINLQDAVELSQARLNNANASQIEDSFNEEGKNIE